MENKKVLSKVALFLAILLLCISILPPPLITRAAPVLQAENVPIQPWPSSFTAYTDSAGKVISDPANEPGISPDDVDFSSGLTKGAGSLPSFYVAGDGSNLFFRMRLLGDPRDDKGGFLSSVWLVKVSDGSATKAVIGLNGKSPHEDYIYVASGSGSAVHVLNKTDNTGNNVPGARVTEDANGDYFLDFQVPVASLTAIDSSITPASILKFAFATSKAANLAVINKDGQDETYGDYAKVSPFAIYRPVIAITGLQDAYTSFPASVSGTTANVANGQTVTLTLTPTSGNGSAITKTATATDNAWSVTGISGVPSGFSYLVTASVVNEKGYTATASQLTGIGASKVTINGNPSYSTYQFPTSFAGTFVRSATGNRNVLFSVHRLSGTDLATETLLTSSMRLGVTGNPGAWSTSSVSYLNGSTPTPGSTYKITAVDEDNANAKAVQIIKYLSSSIAISSPANNTRSDVTTPDVTGTANPGEAVNLYIDNTFYQQTVADGSGNWKISVDKPLTATPVNSYHAFKAVVTDGTSQVASNIVNYGVSALDVSIENGSHPYIYLTNAEPQFRGRSTDTAVNVTITDDSEDSNSYTWSDVPVNSGKWTVKVPSQFTLANGKNYTVVASAKNNGAIQASLHVRVKTETSIAVSSPAPDTRINARGPITGTSEPNANISLNLDKTSTVEVAANEYGVWSYTPSADWTTGSHTAEATTSDEAGNTASAATTFKVGTAVIASVSDVSQSVPYATALADAIAVLGTEVTVNLEGGGTAQVPITWSEDSDPTYSGSAPGAYVFTGTFGKLPEGIYNSNEIPAPKGTVTVLPQITKSIASVVSEPEINVINGTAADKAKSQLGSEVNVNLTGGETATVQVSWSENSEPAYNGATAGTYVFTGSFKTPLPVGVNNNNSVSATGTVHVLPPGTTSIASAGEVNVTVSYSTGLSKAKETLGGTVKVTLEDGSKAVVPVIWDNVSDETTPEYNGNQAATYPFTGTLGPLPEGVDNEGSVKAKGNVTVAGFSENQLKEVVRSLWIRYSPGDIWESVTLPAFLLKDGKYNTDITWTSNKPDIISIEEAPADWGNAEGREFKAEIKRQDVDESVILTATVSKDNLSLSRSFLLIVKSTNVEESKTTSPRSDSNITVNDTEIPISINRTTLSDGSRIDKLIVSPASMDQLLLLAGPGADLEMNFNDKPGGNLADRSDEITMEIPIDALDKLNNQAVQLTTPEGSVRLPAASVAQTQNAGTDLFFRIVPVRAEMKRQAIFDDTLQNTLVKAEAGGKTIRTLDIPREIETNYSGFATEVTLPLTYLTIPSDPLQRQQYLDSLRVFIQHSDGTLAIVGGTGPSSLPAQIVTSNGTPTGLKFTIDKFSTFTFFQVTDPAPVSNPAPSSTPAPVNAKATSGTVSVNDKQIELVLDQPLTAGTLPTEGFMVTMAGRTVKVLSAQITAGNRLVLTVDASIPAGTLLKVGYKAPVTGGTAASGTLDSFALEILNSSVHQKYISGYPDGTFKPENSITRAEMAAILARLLGAAPAKGAGKPYPDVNATHWAAAGIQRMKDTGIMKGYPDGRFYPEKKISRGEMAAVIQAFTGKTAGSNVPVTYSDTAGHWAKYAIEELKNEGIMIGSTDGLFHPYDNLTRAEAVAALNKVLHRGGLTGDFAPTWPDVAKSHWNYAQIEEASHSHESTRISDTEEQWIRFVTQ
ncbi:S-layer homology domain-containing protein [Paenibacillus sp. NFR01]|uniref:S-layer homology domain-containing protein n=1 Tax=Paenibacillus sp. NFR01 TaxID=1566279 RepID=UPI0008C7CF8A|nr:S-layer homology domain-containing protein [Paenibacillus sp. NFR01]SET60692.1 Ig-like domain (group 4) [Paenibacillus sp. NFR01]